MSVGLDIGTKTIKAVELNGDKSKFSLKAAGVVGYSGTEVEKMQDKKEMIVLSDIIRKLFKDAKISSKEVSISLPEPQVFTRIVKLPLLTDQEIASAIRWEAEQYIPIPASDAIVQHEIIERLEKASPPTAVVMVVAAPKNVVEKYVKVVNMAGLTVSTAETELLALTRVFAPLEQSVVLVDSGARSTDVAIARNGKLVFSRSIPTAGVALTRAVARSLGIGIQQADEYKRTYGLSPDQMEGKVSGAIGPVFRILIEEIRKAIHYYQSEEKGDIPSSLILSGGLSGLPGAVETLSQVLNIQVNIGDPFSKINVNKDVQKTLTPYAPLYSVSVGLAMGGI